MNGDTPEYKVGVGLAFPKLCVAKDGNTKPPRTGSRRVLERPVPRPLTPKQQSTTEQAPPRTLTPNTQTATFPTTSNQDTATPKHAPLHRRKTQPRQSHRRRPPRPLPKRAGLDTLRPRQRSSHRKLVYRPPVRTG